MLVKSTIQHITALAFKIAIYADVNPSNACQNKILKSKTTQSDLAVYTCNKLNKVLPILLITIEVLQKKILPS